MYQFAGNENNFGGYTEQQLYVTPKFDNYKDEILAHMNVLIYDVFVMVKAKEFMITNRVRRMRAANIDRFFEYGIEQDTPITISHIISLILYCDYSAYSTKFSSTFRCLSHKETMVDVKKRNSEFWYQSKYFRETIEIYGRRDGRDDSKSGPFFCGIDGVLCIPQFAIRLNSPTSTSRQIEVALNFAQRKGMIIELNNTGHSRAKWFPFLDVAWLSRFPDEDEVVSVGGHVMIRVQSVRIVNTHQNFRDVFRALFIFDAMVSDGSFYKNNLDIQQKDIDFMKHLLHNSSSFDPYVVSVIQSYIRNKKEINLNMFGLWYLKSGQYGMVIQDKIQLKDRENLDFEQMSFTSNLMSAKIFDILSYAKILNINTTFDNSDCFAFNLFYFLDIVCEILTWKLIKIKERMEVTEYKQGMHESWLYLYWSSSSELLIKDCKEKGLEIEFDTKEVRVGDGRIYFDEYLVIHKQ